jgi:hypothetical protein
MEHWEFLIQKDGDRTWLPIQQSPLTLEEGKYRLVAQANRPNLEVEIRVIYQSCDRDRASRQSQSYSRRTNRIGLMMLLPFTELKPGFWKFHCWGDLMSELLGDSWHKSIEIEVVPKPLTASSGQAKSSHRESEPVPDLKVGKRQAGSRNGKSHTPSTGTAPQTLPTGRRNGELYLQQLEQVLQQEIEPFLKKTSDTEPLTESEELLSRERQPPIQYTITLCDRNGEVARTIDVVLAQADLPLHLELPEPTKMAKPLQVAQLLTSPILPPKIAPAPTRAKTKASPRLPNLPASDAKMSSGSVHSSAATVDLTEHEQARELKPSPQNQTAPLSVANSFQSLRLEERFLSRLNSLAIAFKK